MNDLRNPFRLQAAEYIESDSDFLRLFGPGVLDLLPPDAPFGRVQFIRSAPGGGKTSLLKLFTPSVLQTLVALRNHADYKELFQRLREIGAVDDQGVRLVGVMLPCGRTFPDLGDLGLPAPRARRLLLALLDARIMLGALRSALQAMGLRYPEDLIRVRITAPSETEAIGDLRLPCNGPEARSWAESLERSISDVIDAFNPPDGVGPAGHDSLLVLRLLDGASLQIDGEPVTTRWLILLDDVQKLAADQRTSLHETILEQRSMTTVWIAERLEALSRDELLAPGALEGRDYGDVVNLEEAWRRTPKRFENAISTIAERRARMAVGAGVGEPVGSFIAVIDSILDFLQRITVIREALQTVSERVRKVAGQDTRYREWVRARDEIDGDPREMLVGWRSLEILIARQRRKTQLSFELPLGLDELEDKDDSGVRAAAELFLAEEFSFPYYYGPARLASLGSFNVEQYLRLAGDLFEESAAAAVLRRPFALTPERQEQILKTAYDARVSDLPRRAVNGRDVLQFLHAVGTFCHDVTYEPNAPYAPGVNGVAISMQEREQLLGSLTLTDSPGYRRFAEMLATALANNLLHAELDKSVKNQRWMILYLNRIVCVKYDLPLHFGGFRERKLRDLVGWMERGYVPGKTDRLPL